MVENISILDILKTIPTAISDSDIDAKKVSDYYLPFSIGIEFECVQADHFNLEDFKNIPNIMDISIDSGEQRFRIPSGLNGLKCLFTISMLLKKNSLLNPLSGIHYHIDCTDVYSMFSDEIVNDNSEWMLKELDSWGYKGTYNSRAIRFNGGHNWIRFQPFFKTMECRIGEMTFEYDLLFKRIVHLSSIVRRFKEIVNHKYLQTNSPILLYVDDVNKILQNRKIKI